MTKTTEIMVPIDYFLKRTKDFPDDEIIPFLKKIGWSKHTTELQLLMVRSLFMPWQLRDIANDIGHPVLAERLDNEEPTGTHERYIAWADGVAKRLHGIGNGNPPQIITQLTRGLI